MNDELFSAKRFRSIIGSQEDLYFYCVDPGAFYVMEILVNALDNKRIVWVAEGWCADRFVKEGKNFVSLEEFYEIKRNHKELTLVLGSQTNFLRTVNLIRDLNEDKIESVFLFDHWVNYKDHFYDPHTVSLHFPTTVCVIDELAKKTFLQEIQRINLVDKKLPNIQILGHPKIEKCAQIAKDISESEKAQIMKRLNILKVNIHLFLLEPITTDFGLEESLNKLGYNEYTALTYYFENYTREDTFTIIKPHPRQNLFELERFLENASITQSYAVVETETLESLISVSSSIYGMTTLALILAHFAGKEILSIQLNRTEYAKKFSCDYLEEYLVT
ncbi:hypothetical protein [Leptospira yasudae]|uniref:hypothetical protein n=1 Tax=Leptospira yasudae TaxID=2202201 RepID=UPI001082ED99|nr:hypothetical protein [Leptospira yasudae]TGL77744.1 hypothetical protein EHQ77_14110 [Leptospira yasudae]